MKERMFAAATVALVALACGGGLTRPDKTPPPTEIAADRPALVRVAGWADAGCGAEAAVRAVPAMHEVNLPFGFGGSATH